MCAAARSEVPDEHRGKLPSTLLQLLMLVLGAQLKTMSCSVLGILKLCIHPATYNIVGDAGLYILACRHTWAVRLSWLCCWTVQHADEVALASTALQCCLTSSTVGLHIMPYGSSCLQHA